MPYAAGRVINDADSHIMESLDWLSSYADPAIREKLGSMRLEAGGSGAEKAIAKALARQQDPVATAEIAANVVAGPKGWAAYGAIDPGERTKALDDLGFSRQLVFTTFAGSQFMPSPDPDVKYGGARALNRAMADFCRGDKRPDRRRRRAAGRPRRGRSPKWTRRSRRVSGRSGSRRRRPATSRPATRTSTRSGAGSPRRAYPSCCTSARPRRRLPPAYHKNGHPRPKDWLGGGENLRAKDYFSLSFAPQNFLAALALDGVFDRFPALRGGVIELGAGWVPDFLRRLDQAWKGWRKTDPVLAALSAPPSELVRRAVRFTPYATEDAGVIIREGGPELFLFSSDYPHPEGTRNPIERFEGTFAGFDEDTKDRFYRRNFEHMFAG